MDVDRLMRSLARDDKPERVLRIIKQAAPVAGVDQSIRIPGGSIVRPIGLVATLVTSAAVANRQVAMAITDGQDTLGLQLASNTIPATTTSQFSVYGAGGALPTGAAAALYTLPMADVVLPAGYTIGFKTAALDVADQWGSAVLWVEEYLDQPLGTFEEVKEGWLEFLYRSSLAAEGVK